MNDFTDKFTNEIEVIQNYIEEDELDKASNNIKDWSEAWHKDKEFWYKMVKNGVF